MSEPSAPASFRLPRVSRIATRRRETDPAWSIHLATVAFAALVALALAGPWMTINNDGTLGAIREMGYAAVLAAALVAIRPWRQPQRLLVVPWPLLLALGWCWLSLSWALDPAVGLRRLALTTIVLWSLFALVRQLDTGRAVATLRILFVLALLVNYALVLRYPAIGIHGQEGLVSNWRGMMGHKNYAGLTSAVTILLVAFDARRIWSPVRIAVAAAAAYFLFRSDSETSMIMCGAALAFGAVFAGLAARLGQRRLAPPAWAWGLMAAAAVIVVVLAVNPQPVLDDLANDPSGFTGRTQIWIALIKAYVDRPWLGIGYGSFWDLGPQGPIFTYGSGWMTRESQGHNGYLDLLVQIGAVGTLAVLFATIVWPAQRLLRGGNHPVRPLAAALLLFCLGHNFTESSLFDRDGLGQLLMMAAIALLWTATPSLEVRSSARTDPFGPDRRTGAVPAGG